MKDKEKIVVPTAGVKINWQYMSTGCFNEHKVCCFKSRLKLLKNYSLFQTVYAAPKHTDNELHNDTDTGEIEMTTMDAISSYWKRITKKSVNDEVENMKEKSTVVKKGTREKIVIARTLQGKPIFMLDYGKDAYRNPLSGKSGWDAVKTFWKGVVTETNNPYWICFEQSAIAYGATAGAVFGFLFGNYRGQRQSLPNVRELAVTARFSSPALARQVMMDKVLKDSSRAGLKMMWRLTLLVSINMTVLHTAAIYSERYTWWSFLLGGGIAGSLYRFALGPKAMCGGFLVGGTLGLLQAGVCLPWFYITGKNLIELREEYLMDQLAKLKRKAEAIETSKFKMQEGDNTEV